ncbi:SRPBCC family protein [Microbulbifer litoralis]|uniref:SRPBCC family protein n=1 Tax=Microbulbifer litoralis TaxID=2933965 RepID=UPI002027F8B9|nr:SRPBCC domain-containing protein [Microbulbifer sp. GX H0434]
MNDTTAETLSVVVEREIAHPPEKIWRALTQPHLIQEWLMKNDFQPVPGHRFNLHGNWGGVLECEVLVVEPHKTLSYTWNFPHPEAAYNLQSVVTFTLESIDGGTLLRMEQKGFRPDQKQAYGGAKHGWREFFTSLEDILSELD